MHRLYGKDHQSVWGCGGGRIECIHTNTCHIKRRRVKCQSAYVNLNPCLVRLPAAMPAGATEEWEGVADALQYLNESER